ncbi:TetR/AcrR family transcriptional regulator [Bradyrhizobium septentrionale]|uniref:TetR family transcriptional regulator C-terminal domain-containing protein n=1 Tax=Bradyrhizobium septentrionale TaxID=1404411 RepID=A0A974A661_9BRAD|nr:TetR/AcrR family transcriptional regulator [Bradyrhizobium septentrionale]UGY18064.1 TetR/AcrR family transcriptional regulator [Bradyrhizobium septentrionale]UGY26766.1 TetR/AcrR family transcriptional regulator [Bradyrhizobium septentrionale]
MPKPSLRDAILDAGLKAMFRTGYHGTSVRDVTAAAGAPQGSFTNHFRSKELFAAEVLDRYFLYVRGLVAEALDDTTLPPRERLRRYLDLITGKLAYDGFTRGCLIGDFSLEASGSSEMLRAQLDDIFREWRVPFAACIAEAQAKREIASDFDPDALADFLLASWQGAMLRMKVERSEAALTRFKTIAFQTVFKELP